MSRLSKNKIVLNEHNQRKAVGECVNYLQRGYAVVFPTDTIYALGVDALNADAVEYFFALKKRASSKPVSVFVSDFEMARSIADISPRQQSILQHFLPGKFTFVLKQKTSARLNERLSAYTDTIGVRIPDSLFVHALVSSFGKPITASSANVSGLPAPNNIDAIFAQFQQHHNVPDLLIDSGTITNTTPSTIIDITHSSPKIIRMSATDPATMKNIMSRLQNFE